ncbi:PD-(D/E)XK nuclease family protein [uncultured Corynebacterium sp.]|uniref:PD-(D/E)XK nuclease family protein n=1 Tax=uncultured Corynebacterium sp. TaxID=159447 RepID=UPI0025F103E6|nr:PD-(D/E)XK nuclease family protein [uncultured Corynebacterium sp.]
MDITFGWGLDGAAWDLPGQAPGERPGEAPQATLGHATLGPAGLTTLLSTRLGLTGAAIDRPLRIGAYRAALERAPRSWCDASFELDPWSVSKTMLAWRDELVAAGWDGTAVPGGTPRLADLADAEALFDAPGEADSLRDVASTLRAFAADGAAWPLGIDRLTVVGDVAELPAPWPAIIDDLDALGVPVEAAPAPEPLGALRVVTAATEWEAAEAAARILATSPRTSLVATRHTEILDQELARRGLPRLGALESSAQRATAQVLPLFLSAVTGPIDVHDIAAFLDMGLTVVNVESGALRDVGVIPSRVRRPLLDALAAQPGVGGPKWTAALASIADDAREDETDAGARHVALAQDLDRMLRTHRLGFDGGTCPTAAIVDALTWLATRLTRLGGQLDAPEVRAAAHAVSTAVAVLSSRDAVGERELSRIIADCGAATTSPLAGAEASERARVPSPALLRSPGPVVWWGAVDDGAVHRRIWTPDEVRALDSVGVTVPDPGVVAGARSRAELDGLRRAGDVIAIVPRLVDGAATAAHPALAFATHDVTAACSGSVEEVDARELADEGTWNFGGSTLALSVPFPWSPDAEEVTASAQIRRVPAGTHLLPSSLSYSQIETLLVHRLEWLLRYPLRIREGWLTAIPTGNRMIGTFLHAIVEKIVEENLDGADRGVVADCFDALLPHYASELSLPGNARLRQQVEAETLDSIPSLFATLRDGGMDVTGAEAPIERTLTLTLSDPEGGRGLDHEVVVRGFRDLDARTREGGTVVVDMKYSVSKRKYRDLIEQGRSLQLATYAWSVADDGGEPTDLPLSSVVTAYFELKYGRFDSTDERLGDSAAAPIDPDTLWRRAVASVEDALSEIAFAGVVRDEGNRVLVDAAGNESALKKSSANAADTAAMNDRFLPMDNAKYVDYGIITGVRADLS